MTEHDVGAADIRALQGLIARLAVTLAEFASPDGNHRALRSPYSRKGVCETYPAGQHSPLCGEMFAVLREAADYLEAIERPAAEQPLRGGNIDCVDIGLFESEVAG